MTSPQNNAALQEESESATPRLRRTSNVTELTPRAESTTHSPLLTPAELRSDLPLSEEAKRSIFNARERLIRRVEKGQGAPIAIVGPCSIHCETAALEYAERLVALQERIGDRVQLVMRVYFEKPRTTVGWKGFLYDPDLDGSDDLARGLVRARSLLVKIAELGLPIATEILDPLAADYLEDCLSWVAIGARTSESQIHRQVASRLPCPVGFKNGTDGSVTVAAQASESAASPHTHLGIDENGRVAVKRSLGNRATHLVLRGGKSGPNFDAPSVAAAARALEELGQRGAVLVDCSHGNSEKDHNRQIAVARAVMAQMSEKHADVLGLMLESHLVAGRQSMESPRQYGVSVTDACIDFGATEGLLLELSEVAQRLARR
jgi:3-deoxy-7-phosphoheptulonate synthase